MVRYRDEQQASIAAQYRDFAANANGKSPRYVKLGNAVAKDKVILDFLRDLPAPKRQPNLLFAAACHLLGQYADIRALRMLIATRGGELAATMLARRTQTNEAARCATLLPLLASLPQPLALLEVGASAGLTLLPDRYSYDYGGHQLRGTDPQAPVLACEPRGPVPLPGKVPEVAWRAGLDLNPLDVGNDDDMRWLRCLLWPGETGRRERLDAAVATARRDPPKIHKGDLVTDVADLASQAPADATLVIFHSAVLAYVAPAGRERFAGTVRKLDAVWLSNEGPRVLPGVGAGLTVRDGFDGFVLVQDGTTPRALTDGHGTWLEWLPLPGGAGERGGTGERRVRRRSASGRLRTVNSPAMTITLTASPATPATWPISRSEWAASVPVANAAASHGTRITSTRGANSRYGIRAAPASEGIVAVSHLAVRPRRACCARAARSG